MMTEEDNPNGGGPVFLSAGEMILWCLAIAFFGVFIAVPLRRQVIIKEKLPFPSGTATAQMIGVLHNTPLVVKESKHGGQRGDDSNTLRRRNRNSSLEDDEESSILHVSSSDNNSRNSNNKNYSSTETSNRPSLSAVGQQMAPLGSSANIIQPPSPPSSLSNTANNSNDDDGRIEIGGEDGEFSLDKTFLQEDNWRMNMTALGISFTLSGLYTVLSYFVPVIAAIPVFDWLSGMTIAFGATWQWFFTPSLSVVVLSLVAHRRYKVRIARHAERRALLDSSRDAAHRSNVEDDEDEEDVEDAPIDQLVPLKIWVCGLILSSVLCLFLIWVVFRDQHMPAYATFLALVLGSLLSVLGVRALGSTDLNPVSGIGKVSQFVFAGVVPGGIVANLIAGGIAEAGAQQAGDLMQDLKTGHLMGASPKSQFWGQLIGSLASVFISTGVYKLYSSAYKLPGDEFAVPTAKIWLELARLVNGQSLPAHTVPFILGFAALFAGLTILTTVYSDVAFLKSTDEHGNRITRPKWLTYIPSGIAFAIGMYNLPNFTLARFIGGVISVAWDAYCKHYPGTKYAKLGRHFLLLYDLHYPH
ncbi:hypothetical protein BGZ95_001919 [Linnemannia exigua]|uniref:Oligopeptide transporter n=1 Tax=Linnemannia exigua TaxID=604196 RepID=A0AAD4H2E4_9FUNG|nr:hypothetical protein BGZ95_001919 [Linnemannia exigua]